MSDIIGLLGDIIGLWWVLKSKNDTNQKDAQSKMLDEKG